MDILKEFDSYYPKWCKKNHKPLSPKKVVGSKTPRFWKNAWEDFMKEVLLVNYEDIKSSYLHKEEKVEKALEEAETEEIIDGEKIVSNWDKIQSMLN